MHYKWVGAIFVIIGCGSFGFSLCAAQKRDEWNLRQLVAALDYMQCELQFRLTPLPELCRQAGMHGKGNIGEILHALSQELENPLCPNVGVCLERILMESTLSGKTKENLMLLGESLGRFDLEGQMKGLEAVRQRCREDIKYLTRDKVSRMRSYQTLGLCAGAALVILFI